MQLTYWTDLETGEEDEQRRNSPTQPLRSRPVSLFVLFSPSRGSSNKRNGDRGCSGQHSLFSTSSQTIKEFDLATKV